MMVDLDDAPPDVERLARILGPLLDEPDLKSPFVLSEAAKRPSRRTLDGTS